MKHKTLRTFCLALLTSASLLQNTSSANALPEFAYREIQLQFVDSDGQPVPHASVYGFCPELNLVWPRRDHEMQKRSDVLWHESFLGKTDAIGGVKVTVPQGKWGFFAVGTVTNQGETVVAGWTDFRARATGEKVRLAAVTARRWSLGSADGAICSPEQIYLKPSEFPIWIPLRVTPGKTSLAIEVTSGHLQLWASGAARADRPGFIMSWGTLSDKLPDGTLLPAGNPALLECQGGQGKAALHWMRGKNFGLDGELPLCHNAKVWLAPGAFTLGYQRPIAPGCNGRFLGHNHSLQTGQRLTLNFDSPLRAGIDQSLSKANAQGEAKLTAQLYLTDTDGHLVSALFDDVDQPTKIGAAVVINGQRTAAKPVLQEVESLEINDDGETTLNSEGHLLFIARLGSPGSAQGAVWEFAAPPGVLPQSRLTGGDRVTVLSSTFRMEVPRVLDRSAKIFLTQADGLAANLERVSQRARKHPVTTILINPEKRGASAGINGKIANFGTSTFFSDDPTLRHGLVHELGHIYGFTHGGLHETVIEATRCYGAAQISQQPAKWLFLDRMNGLARKELAHPNIGLYLYCYAQGGPAFLNFVSTWEPTVLRQLTRQGFTTDELTAALLTVGLGRNLTRVCQNYGLQISPERVAEASEAVRAMVSQIVIPRPSRLTSPAPTFAVPLPATLALVASYVQTPDK